MIITLLVFLLIFGLLVFIHELGHFLAAKSQKIGVEEFAFGFPPRVLTKKVGETNYSLNLIPLGGYVKMVGEENVSKAKNSFSQKSIWSRLLVIVAGVTMNFLLAGILFGIGYGVGMTPVASDPATLPGTKDTNVAVAGVLEDSAAAKAGIVPGDTLLDFKAVTDLQTFSKENRGKAVTINYRHYQENKSVSFDLPDKDAPLGVSIVDMTKVKMKPLTALGYGYIESGRTVKLMISYLGQMVSGLFHHDYGLAQEVTGPVGIYKITGEAVKLGFVVVLQLTALLSVNLALVNILPIPALDGGKLLFVALEGIFKKRVVREEVENIIHMVGFGLLLLLVVIVTYQDIVKLK